MFYLLLSPYLLPAVDQNEPQYASGPRLNASRRLPALSRPRSLPIAKNLEIAGGGIA